MWPANVKKKLFFLSHVLQTQEGIGLLLGTDMEINFCCHKFCIGN